MNYRFEINGKHASLNQVAKLNMLSEEFEELMETGSVEVNNQVVLSIKSIDALSEQTLKLALFSTLSVLDEDSPDGLPDKYAKVFKRLGNELLEIDDISYDKILDELINTLDGTKS